MSGSKTWEDADNQDGKRPDAITINLLADNEKIDSRTVTAEDDWSWKFTGLPKYKAGVEITYTVTEELVEGYTAEYDGCDVTNIHIPEKTSINVTKKWRDVNNLYRSRPSSITVRLLADGEETDRIIVLDKENSWEGTFSDLDVYKAGNKIEYTIAEVDVPERYTSKIKGTAEDGFKITNTYKPPVPDTGDNSNLYFWLSLNLSSVISLAGIYLYKKRKNPDKQH